MSVTIYRQSKAFVLLSRSNLARFGVSTGVCIAGYLGGKQLQQTSNKKACTYGRIIQRYSTVCGCILWGHVLVTTCGALYFARVKNFPRIQLMQRGFVYGERMGFSSMLVYAVTRELSNREWFAQIAASSYTGLKYSMLQNLTGWAVYEAFMRGIYFGIAIFSIYAIWNWVFDVYTIFKDPNISYSAWHKFDVYEYTVQRVAHFFNLDGWMYFFEHRNLRDMIVNCRNEMNELEELMKKANISKSELTHLNWDETNTRMFDILDEAGTGRLQFDNVMQTNTTAPETLLRTFDPVYKYETPLIERNKGKRF